MVEEKKLKESPQLRGVGRKFFSELVDRLRLSGPAISFLTVRSEEEQKRLDSEKIRKAKS